MFDRDSWQELWSVLKANPLRTMLTAFGVCWGIFMLIIMLGAGSGLDNGASSSLGNFATNSVHLWAMRTSVPYQGLTEGRMLRFTNEDTRALETIQDIEVLCPRVQLGGYRGGNNVTRGTKAGAFSVYGEHPDIVRIQAKDITAGRWLNPLDFDEARKICVIGKRVQEVLFEDEDPLGEYITINGVNFRVVGVFDAMATSHWNSRETESVMIPLTTYQLAFKSDQQIGWYSFMAKPGIPASVVTDQVLTILKDRHKVAPEDEQAFGNWSMEEEFDKVEGVLFGINFLVWFVGAMTLFAGIIGVTNIMLVTVRERTKEIGIRRAIGATPRHIIMQILLESVTITALAGYMGVVAGIIILEGISLLTKDVDMFRNPGVDVSIALQALVVLVISGLLAGLIPAARAVSINPVDALREE